MTGDRVKGAWALVDEVWQIVLWMLGLGLVIGIVGKSFQVFLALPSALKLVLWIAIAVICKHWRDIRSWFDKQKAEARN